MLVGSTQAFISSSIPFQSPMALFPAGTVAASTLISTAFSSSGAVRHAAVFAALAAQSSTALHNTKSDTEYGKLQIILGHNATIDDESKLGTSAAAPVQNSDSLNSPTTDTTNSPPRTIVATTTANMASNGNCSSESQVDRPFWNLPPRPRACVSMAAAMALHFGGYEFARSAGLALFTSASGFSSPAAYPLAIGVVTPASLMLLYWYGTILKARGPRIALRRSTLGSWSVLAATSGSIALAMSSGGLPWPSWLVKTVVTVLFITQNSYAHLVYTQQWSFLGSVMTPDEGAKYFSMVAGLSSIVCTSTASSVSWLLPHVFRGSLPMLILCGTCSTLALSILLSDYAYRLSEENGFDPAASIQAKSAAKAKQQPSDHANVSLLKKTTTLFRRVPTLAALFGEVVSFQSLSTIVNICFVRQLKATMPIDTDRAVFSGKFFALVNGSSGLLQFFVLPLARQFLEPRWVYRVLPAVLLPFVAYLAYAAAAASQEMLLYVSAAAFFAAKTLDYAFRNVVGEMVYQPLDFDARFVGKEVIGVLANRAGKSGMSLLVSFFTAHFAVSVVQLSQASLAVAAAWTYCSSVWLSRLLPSNREAQKRVEERQEKTREVKTK